jgi:beta-ureidopropionase
MNASACRAEARYAKAGGIMPRKLFGDLMQAAAPLADPSMPIDKIRKAAIDPHIPLIEDAGQNACWYDIAKAVPGPTMELMARYAKKNHMMITAAVYDDDGTYFCDGSSYFVDPRGNLTAMGSEDTDELAVAEQLP